VPRQSSPYKSEGELCSAFIEAARAMGWLAYPETSGVDILLVATADTRFETEARRAYRELYDRRRGRDRSEACRLDPGTQVAIEAKLRPNIDVLGQAMPHDLSGHRSAAVPDYHAVLVPYALPIYGQVAKRCGVLVFQTMHAPRYGEPGYPRGDWTTDVLRDLEWWPRWAKTKRKGQERLWVPPVVLNTAAGVPSPLRITRWKVKAVQLMNELRITGGTVTRADVKAMGLPNVGLFVRSGWLVDTGERQGRRHLYKLGPSTKERPDVLYPDLAAQLIEAGLDPLHRATSDDLANAASTPLEDSPLQTSIMDLR